MSRLASLCLVSLVMVACDQSAPSVDDGPDGEPDVLPSDRIAIAMTAAPLAISSAASIMELDVSGALVQLRAGTNGWVCLPDGRRAPTSS